MNRTDEARALDERIQALRKASADTPGLSHDENAPVELTDGALLIEVDRGMRMEPATDEVSAMGLDLDEILTEQHLGEWQGLVRIPESATLFYYGLNAQAMFDAIEPTLRSDPRFEGAVITIRQRSEQHEVAIPHRRLN